MFIEIEFVYIIIQTFKVYCSVVFSIFTIQYSHHHYLEHFCYPRKKPHTQQCPLQFCLPQPLATTSLLSVSVHLPVLEFHVSGILEHVILTGFFTQHVF